MIHNEALSHKSSHNPFNFQHFDLNHFNVIKNGQCVFPKAFQPDFDSDNYLDSYRHMYDSIGYGISNYTCSVSKEAFKKGRCFLTADLTPDHCNSFNIHPDEKGKLDAELGFIELNVKNSPHLSVVLTPFSTPDWKFITEVR